VRGIHVVLFVSIGAQSFLWLMKDPNLLVIQCLSMHLVQTWTSLVNLINSLRNQLAKCNLKDSMIVLRMVSKPDSLA